MSDLRRHRGAHPDDPRLFSPEAQPALRAAVAELSWLLSRGYRSRSAIALVGDRHDLTARQRIAVLRCAGSDSQCAERRTRATCPTQASRTPVWIDGFNVLTTVEAALGGGVLLLARDGAMRDMASMHGSYRVVEETRPAVEAIVEALGDAGVEECRWLLDAPVSNSGRLAALLRERSDRGGLGWQVEVVPDPDRLLESAPPDAIVASADSRLMDRATRNWQLARAAVDTLKTDPWIVDLS